MRKRFLDLYDEYHPKLYAYVLVRVRQKQEAEDIVQQTFTKALDKIDDFKPRRGATFGSWLFQIAKNELVDRVRKDSKLTFCETEVLDEKTADGSILNDLIDQESWREVICQIEKLNELEREVITLKYLADMSYNDIAKITEKKPNTLAVILKRALEKIREEINV